MLELECLGNLCIQYVYDFAKGVVYIVVDLFIGKPFVDVHEIMLGEGDFSCFYSLLMDVRRFFISLLCVAFWEGVQPISVVCGICMWEEGVLCLYWLHHLQALVSSFPIIIVCALIFLYCCFLVDLVNMVHYSYNK